MGHYIHRLHCQHLSRTAILPYILSLAQTTLLHPFLGLPHTPYPFLGSTLNSSIIMNLLNSEVGFLCSPRFGGWISAEQVIKQQVDDAASMDDTTLTSVSWAMSVGDLTIVDAAREWFRSSSLAQRTTTSQGPTSVKTIQKMRERIIKGCHPLCQTENNISVAYPYL